MIDKIMKNWLTAQEAGAELPCPRCGLLRMNPYLNENALSLKAEVYVCNDCGMEEAIEAIPSYQQQHPAKELADWFVVKNVFRQHSLKPNKKGNFNLLVEHNIVLKQEDIDDIMVGALEGGINYWCNKSEVVGKYLGEYASEQISRGGSLMLFDYEAGAVYELTIEKFLNGFALWVSEGHDSYGAITGANVDCCNIDGPCADEIIQLAIFGEVRYA